MPAAVPPTRRSVLAGLGLVAGSGLLGACTAPTTGTTTPGTASPGPTSTSAGPDPLLAVLAVETSLIAAYDATLRHYPALRGRLSAIRADHVAHAAALRSELVGPTGATPAATLRPGSGSVGPTRPSGSGSATGSPSTSGSGSASVRVPATKADAVAALADRERAATTSTGAAALVAPAQRSVLLGSIAAGEASHLVVLS